MEFKVLSKPSPAPELGAGDGFGIMQDQFCLVITDYEILLATFCLRLSHQH